MTSRARVAAYGLARDGDRFLVCLYTPPGYDGHWTLPGGGVDFGEDPVDAVVREVEEETGLRAEVVRLLGVDSRILPSAHRRQPDRPDLHAIGVYYEVRITGGELRAEPNGDTRQPSWLTEAELRDLDRARIIDTGLSLYRLRPPTGHTTPTEPGALIHH